MPALEVPDNLPSLDSKPVDSVSIMYTQSLGLDIGTPIKVKGDGNCLFNSISTLLYGHEERAIELRARTCIQMCNNKDRYLSRPDASDTMSLSPSFEEASTACATNSSWSSAWNLMALSDVIGISIKSHYPPMYGKEHLAYKTLNTTYAPTQAETDRTIAVMWTHTNWGVPGMWNPNHFVPLASTVTNHQKSCHSDTLMKCLPMNRPLPTLLRKVHRGVNANSSAVMVSPMC